jgi:hypothetical protein
MTILAQSVETPAAPVSELATQTTVGDFSMLGGTRIMSSAADAERSARLISWLCALVSGRDPRL